MNQQTATLRPNQYTSNNTIRKSQKVLAYPSNFHLKTEQQQREQDHKSPEQDKPQFRQTTWRKPRMPYNRFPDAFQMRQKGKSIDKVIPDQYDKLVKERQYEQVKKYLNPISLEKRPEKIKRQQDNGNPLETYKRYLEMQKKFTKQFQDGETIDPVRKSKPLSLKKSNTPVYKISQCITLDVIKRGHNTGTIKKMLHVPTLKLMCVREEPTNTRESRNSIKDWVNFWHDKLGRQGATHPFIKIHSVSYNYPEGAISILIDYFEQGSLLDLLEVVLTLPETVIREVFQQVFVSLKVFYDMTEMQFGGFSPSQILIGNQGQIKLGMGLYYHFNNSTSNSIYHIKTPQKTNIFQMNMTQKNFMKSSISQPANLEAQRSLDIFKIGLVMLQCAIGGYENYQQSDYLHEILKIVFSEDGQKIIQRDNVCCLIHSEVYLIEWANREQRLKRDQIDPSKLIYYAKILKDRFSVPFVNFLCSCLKLQHSKRAPLPELLEHSFLRSQSKDSRTVDLTLKDLISIRNADQESFIESTKFQRLDKFISHVLQVLSNCSRQQVISLLRYKKQKIMNLGKYIGVNYYGMGQKLYQAITDLAKSMKD